MAHRSPDEALASAIADKTYWEVPNDEAADRDTRAMRFASHAGETREAMAPAQYGNRSDVFGGGLRRMTDAEVGRHLRSEDPHFHAPRYVPVGFSSYHSPVVDPADYRYYQMASWRVAVPRSLPDPSVRDLLHRIYRHGPGSVGYVRLGDTLVPQTLGPGDRQTLAESASRYGDYAGKYMNF